MQIRSVILADKKDVLFGPVHSIAECGSCTTNKRHVMHENLVVLMIIVDLFGMHDDGRGLKCKLGSMNLLFKLSELHTAISQYSYQFLKWG